MTSKVNSPDKLLSEWLRAKIPYEKPSYWTNLEIKSRQKALFLFRQASQRIPAYRSFLKSNRVDWLKIKGWADWEKIPPTDKKNYIEKYNLKERSWDGSLDHSTMISLSSGTSGTPQYWPRGLENEIDGAASHEFLFKSIFLVSKRKTLFLNGFALGNGIAGTFTSSCVNFVAWKGYPITLMTPGYYIEDMLQVLADNARYFDQVLICGHTPFLKEIIDSAARMKLFSRIPPVRFLGTGQSVTEKWRSYILKRVGGQQNYYSTFINLYGSSDAALMGYETPTTIFLRQQIADKNLSQQFFNDPRVPSLFNYDPALTFFGICGKELTITKNSGAPLINYNIKDEGGLIAEPSRFKNLLTGSQKILGRDWATANKLPFVYLFGREKFMVKFFGAIIYVEHAQLAMDQFELQDFVTGRFVMQITEDKKQNQQLNLHVELQPQTDPSIQISELITTAFIREVTKINREYLYVVNHLKDRAKPIIVLHKHGDEPLFPVGKAKKFT